MGRKGDVVYNPNRREKVLVVETGAENGGHRLAMLVTQEPTDVRMPEHLHPKQRESFTIKAGALTYVLAGGAPQLARAGETLIVEPGVPHNWWNGGPETLEMVGVIEPAGRWLEFMETIYGLINEGKIKPGGGANPLQMAVIAWEFKDEWVPTAIPKAVRVLVLPVLAVIGRVLGYRPTYPRFAEHESAVASV